MPRPPREWIEGAVYHLFSRGSDRRPIFESYHDYAEFMFLLGHYADAHRVDCFAWALMPNHWHLVARSPDGGLSGFVKHLNHRFSLRANRRVERTAHRFRTRFGCVLQETEEQFLWTIRYVLRNPLEAGLCAAACDASWTSYRATLGIAATPPFLAAKEVLAHFGPPRHSRDHFAAFLES